MELTAAKSFYYGALNMRRTEFTCTSDTPTLKSPNILIEETCEIPSNTNQVIEYTPSSINTTR